MVGGGGGTEETEGEPVRVRGGRVGGRMLRWASRGARSGVVAPPKEAERSSGSARGQCGGIYAQKCEERKADADASNEAKPAVSPPRLGPLTHLFSHAPALGHFPPSRSIFFRTSELHAAVINWAIGYSSGSISVLPVSNDAYWVQLFEISRSFLRLLPFQFVSGHAIKASGAAQDPIYISGLVQIKLQAHRKSSIDHALDSRPHVYRVTTTASPGYFRLTSFNLLGSFSPLDEDIV